MGEEDTFVKRCREQLGTSQRNLATKAGLSSGQLSNIEAGKHGLSAETARSLGGALSVDPMALVVAQGFDALRVAAEQGTVGPGEVAQKAVRLLKVASVAGALNDGEVRQFVQIGKRMVSIAEKAAVRVATKTRPGMYEERSRNSVELKRSKPDDPEVPAALREQYRLQEANYGGGIKRRKR